MADREQTESAGNSWGRTTDSGRRHENRRSVLQIAGVVGTASIAGCSQFLPLDDENDDSGGPETASEDGDVDDADDSDDDETDLSEYEDGSFSGGDPVASDGERDGVEITVVPGGVDDRLELTLDERIQVDLENVELAPGVDEDLLIPDTGDDEEDDDE